MNFETRILKLKSRTWSRDSCGLYDFESGNYFSRKISIRSPGLIVRDGNQVGFLSDQTTETYKPVSGTNIEVLAMVSLEDGCIKVRPLTDSSDSGLDHQLWKVIRECTSTSKEGHLLKCNDFIKLGRVIFKVKQIKFKDESNERPNSAYKRSIIDSIKLHFEHLNQKNQKTIMSHEEMQGSFSSACRICLSDQCSSEDPFISPCACIGSMLYVHLSCLQNWVKTKLNTLESKNVISINWKTLTCELCKTQLPFSIRHAGQDYSLIPVDTSNIDSYVTLESVSRDQQPTGLHIINMSDTQKITIGRGHDCDLRIGDITVSRMHTELRINQGKIYIKDRNSKFGTLILKKKETVFDEHLTSSSLQNGRTILKFSLTRPWITYFPCIWNKMNNSAAVSLSFKNVRKNTMVEEDFDLINQSLPTDRINIA